jgi:hypothetical protein
MKRPPAQSLRDAWEETPVVWNLDGLEPGK